MDRFLQHLDGFSARLEVHRVEMKRRMAEEIDRHIDNIQRKVQTFARRVRRHHARTGPRVKTKVEDDVESHEETVGQSELPTERDRNVAGPSNLSANRLNRKRKRTRRHVPKRARIEDSSDDDEQEGNESNCGKRIKTNHINCPQENCDAKLTSLKLYHEHLNDQHGLKRHPCLAKNCSERFDNQTLLSGHLKDQHQNTTQWPCGQCSSKYSTRNSLLTHMWDKHQEGEFQCGHDGCSFIATTRSKIHSHYMQKHPMNVLVCGECGRSFISQLKLTIHERIHGNMKPFKCIWPDCGNASAQRSTVVRHIRTQHFKLPRTLKEQKEQGITDDRNPSDYIQEEDQ